VAEHPLIGVMHVIDHADERVHVHTPCQDVLVPHLSHSTTLTLHAVRILGFADTGRVARRFRLDQAAVESTLEDFRASGWVTRSEFGGTAGWSLTKEGRRQHERLMAAELDTVAARPAVSVAHQAFVPLNAQFQKAVTKWQLRPIGGNTMSANDHTDFRWDDRVLQSLQSVGRLLFSLEADLTGQLVRFEGYSKRYDAATARALAGRHDWIDGVGIDSCHVVWMELHEDLLGTLGLQRGDGN
jgi:hypothetical protein